MDTRGNVRLADFGASKKIEGILAATHNSSNNGLKGTV